MLVIEGEITGLVVHLYPYFFFQIIEHPQVVVSHKEVYGYACIGQLGQFP